MPITSPKPMPTARNLLHFRTWLACLTVFTSLGFAQRERSWQGVSHVIVPQARAFAFTELRSGVRVTNVEVQVEIRERTARTVLDIWLANAGQRQSESVLLLPVPDGAVVSSFLFDGQALEPSATVLPRGEARATYDDIVRRLKDPALLEFAGYNLIRSSVFPVPAGGKQHLRLSYEHILLNDGDRVDYFLPRSESCANDVPWKVEIRIDDSRPILLAYSPSHTLDQTRLGNARNSVHLRNTKALEPGSLRLSYLLEGPAIGASLLAYPDPTVGGGYFLLMAGVPASLRADEPPMPREVTIVLDRSGSMAGEKLDQTLAAVRQVIEGLDPGESFNIIDYSSQVAMFAPAPVGKSRETILAARRYLEAIRPTGGTNIHDALLQSLRQQVTPGHVPFVLFLTDGLPTVGRTNEVEIREMVQLANQGGRRIFTFGVGQDVNVPLLDAISDGTRGVGTYVLPGEDVETKVASVFRKLRGPLLSDVQLAVFDESGALSTRALQELFPSRLPDIFEGEPLILLGQYRATGRLKLRFSGKRNGRLEMCSLRIDFRNASVQNAFVPRLWAGRKIAYLVDELRQAGARHQLAELSQVNIFEDPRFRELAEEILMLSTRFGILSEYTSFLATEGTALDNWADLNAACRAQLDQRAVQQRSGESAVNQGRNFNQRKVQTIVDYSNAFWNENSEQVTTRAVQPFSDSAFFFRNRRWIDSQAITDGAGLVPEETYALGSAGYDQILRTLIEQGRQGMLSLEGDILLRFDGKNVLIKNPVNQR